MSEMNQSKRNRHKKNEYGVNVGSSSLLMIFVVLCLISFAALSIVSANADKKLSEKMLTRTTAYYEACNSAEDSLAAIDQVLLEQYRQCTTEDEYFQKVGHSKSYLIPFAGAKKLYVEIKIMYPRQEHDPFYRITSWKVLPE